MSAKSTTGILLTLSYCVITALSCVFIRHMDSTVSPAFIALFTFLIATLFFNLSQAKHLKQTYQTICREKKPFIILNLLTAVIWMGTFYSLKYIPPSINLSIYMGIAPLLTLLLTIPFKSIQTHTKSLTIGISALIITAVLAITEYHYHSNLSTHALIIGVTLAVLAGSAGALYTIYSKKLHNQNYSVSHVLSVRFYLLILITATMSYQLPLHDILTTINWPELVLMSVVTAIIPIFLKQSAIPLLSPQRINNLMPLTPLFAYAITISIGSNQFHLLTLILVLSVSILLIFFNLHKSRFPL